MKVKVNHAHLSGKFSRSAELLRAQVMCAAEWADVITLTEVNYADRGDVLYEIPGWTVVRGHDGPMGESAIMVRADTWHVHKWSTHLLDDNVPANRNSIWVVLALLELIHTGHLLLLSAGHLPASVEGSWRERTGRVLAHIKCVGRWRRVMRHLRKRYQPDAVLAVADWNLNLLRGWVRVWVRTAWPSMRPPARKNTPTNWDLGKRLISWAVGRHTQDLTETVLPHDPASDHAGVHLTYSIEERSRVRN